MSGDLPPGLHRPTSAPASAPRRTWFWRPLFGAVGRRLTIAGAGTLALPVVLTMSTFAAQPAAGTNGAIEAPQASTAQGTRDGDAAIENLDEVTVSADRYRAAEPDVPRGVAPLLGSRMRLEPAGFTIPSMAKYVVTATRAPQEPGRVAGTAHVLPGDVVSHTPAMTLDSVLRGLPSFSLFRRSDSLTAHPTAQGVSLRGIGPSGASRSAVLLDGIPLNDPFGGWVHWTKIPRDAVARVEVVPGGGAVAWETRRWVAPFRCSRSHHG